MVFCFQKISSSLLQDELERHASKRQGDKPGGFHSSRWEVMGGEPGQWQ